MTKEVNPMTFDKFDHLLIEKAADYAEKAHAARDNEGGGAHGQELLGYMLKETQPAADFSLFKYFPA